MKNLPDFSWIADDETRLYCENNFVNDDTLDLIRDGKVLREYQGALVVRGGISYRESSRMLVYCKETGRYLHTGRIDA